MKLPTREQPAVRPPAKIIPITGLLAERQAAEWAAQQAAQQAAAGTDRQAAAGTTELADAASFSESFDELSGEPYDELFGDPYDESYEGLSDESFEGPFGRPIDRSYEESFDGPLYRPFTLKAAIELACPPTWVAAITSAMIGGVAAITINPLTLATVDLRFACVWVLMLVIAVLMQSAVNTINDYEDFKTGLDTAETILDQTDASIVYNAIDPKSARNFAIALLAVSAVLGLVVVYLSAWPLLVVGLVATAVVVLYSAGPKPISYIPLGEVFAGLFLGAFVICSTYYALTLSFSPAVITVTVPSTITIALILQTNNTCDIGRDTAANRRTLPILLGLKRSVRVLRVLAWATPIYMVIWVAAFDVIIWRSFILLFLDVGIAVGLYFLLKARLAYIVIGAYDLVNRASMMANINRFCRSVSLSWMAILLICWILGDILAL